jgi:enoyl-CoA hydratase
MRSDTHDAPAAAAEHFGAERTGGAGRITLDRPAKINALTPAMVRGVRSVLERWADDDSLRTVVLDGAGPRGFCAGGDLRAVLGAFHTAAAFWTDEYRLNARIAGYAKPIVAFMTGIVMGGGVGLSAHARHRVVSGSTRLAMPEVALGIIPDVGATWLLSRSPGEIGTYFALTGTSVGPADALLLGLADAFVPETGIDALRTALLREAPPNDAAVREIIARYAAPAGPAPLAAERASIDHWFSAGSVEEIVAALDADESDFARVTAATLAARSPTSLKLTLRALREARRCANVHECLQLEYRVMSRRHGAADFREGIRAAIIDKDRRPRWEPADLRGVTAEAVDAHFASLGSDEWHV